MISPLLLLSALTVLCHEPPKAELVLKESYLISTRVISSIVPLTKQYLCLTTFGGEIKVFDRFAKKVASSDEPLKKMGDKACIRNAVVYKNYLYAHVSDDYLYCFSFEWKDESKPPVIGPAKVMDLKGNKVRQLWGIDGAALCFTDASKIYWLEDGQVVWDKFIGVPNLLLDNKVWLITVGTLTKLLVYREKQLEVFEFPTLKKEKEFSLPGPFVDITFSKDRFFVMYIQRLGVMDLQGNIKYSNTYDHRHLKYIESKNLLLLSFAPEVISIASAEGEFGKDVKIPTGVGYPFVDGNLVYFGFDTINHEGDYVGGAYLRVYEIK